MKAIETLNEILGSTIKVKILRHLATGYEGKTGRQLANIASVSQPAVLKPLGELVNQGILIKTIIGKSHSYSLNKKNILVKEGLLPIFKLETDILPRFGQRLKEKLPDEINSVILYGSIARGTDLGSSDWDVLVLCPNDDVKKKAVQILSEITQDLAIEFSSNLDVKTMTVKEYRKRFLSGDTFARNIYEDFINSRVQNPLFGKSLLEILKSQNK